MPRQRFFAAVLVSLLTTVLANALCANPAYSDIMIDSFGQGTHSVLSTPPVFIDQDDYVGAGPLGAGRRITSLLPPSLGEFSSINVDGVVPGLATASSNSTNGVEIFAYGAHQFSTTPFLSLDLDASGADAFRFRFDSVVGGSQTLQVGFISNAGPTQQSFFTLVPIALTPNPASHPLEVSFADLSAVPTAASLADIDYIQLQFSGIGTTVIDTFRLSVFVPEPSAFAQIIFALVGFCIATWRGPHRRQR